MTDNLKTYVKALCLSTPVLLLFAFSISPLYQFEGDDVCVFKQMGLLITNGGTPYADLFDNKGILLYLLYAIGMAGNCGKWGVFLINCLVMALTVALWMNTAALVTGATSTCIPAERTATTGQQHSRLHNACRTYVPVVIALLAYVAFQTQGGMTEDICLPVQAYVIYLAARNIHTGSNTSTREYAVIGLLLALTVFVRFNNACGILAFLLFDILCCSGCRKAKCTGLAALLATALSVVVIIYIIMYGIYGTEGVGSMNYAMFGSILTYATLSDAPTHNYLYIHAALSLYLLGAMWLMHDRQNREGRTDGGGKNSEPSLRACTFATILLVTTFASFGRLYFNHYFILLLPAYVFCALFLRHHGRLLAPPLLACLLISTYKTAKAIGMAGNENQIHTANFYSQTDSIMQLIPDDERHCIFNLNGGTTALEVLQRQRVSQCNRFPIRMNNTLFAQVRELDVTDTSICWVIVSPSSSVTPKDALAIETHYEEMHATHFDKDTDNLIFYKRKRTNTH